MATRPSIFITGAARGIGRACAQRFAAGGYFVGLYDIEAEALAELAAELGARPSTRSGGEARVCHQALDVRDRAAIMAALDHFAAATGGRMDVLLNNAGVMSVGPFEAIEPEAHRRMIAINFQGVVELAHASFELLRDTPGARLINMSSGSAVHGVPEMACYSATKHAVRGLSEALEIEWAEHDIRVCDVMPMFVDTALLTNTRRMKIEELLGVRLKPADVAEVVWAAATSSRRRVHWPAGAQAKLLHYGAKLVPTGLQRRALAWMSSR